MGFRTRDRALHRNNFGYSSICNFAHGNNIKLQYVGITVQRIVQIWQGAAPEEMASANKKCKHECLNSNTPVTVDEFLNVCTPISANVHKKPVAVYKRALDPMHCALS